MFAEWLYRMYRKGERACAIREKERLGLGVPVEHAPTPLDHMFANAHPAIVAFKIDNGYVLRAVDITNDAYGNRAVGATGYVYCKDHAAIAEHLVSEAAKEKQGIHTGKNQYADRITPQLTGGSVQQPSYNRFYTDNWS